MKLSILIPTIVGREAKLKNLLAMFGKEEPALDAFPHIDARIEFKELSLEICIAKDDRQISIGEKRNKLLNDAAGDYVAFIDDDDRIRENYISLLMEGIDKGVDCCSLVGEITFDGKNPKPFIHSIKHDRYWEDERAYYRFPNHLNCIKSEIAKQFTFPLKNFSEDTEWAVKVHESGLIKTEHEINETIYFYDFKPNK